MKRAYAFLVLLTVLASAAACSSGNTGSGSSGAASNGGSAASSVSASGTTAAKLGLPDGLDYGGRTVTVLASDENVPYTYFELPEEMNGDVMNDAVYDRNKKTEELLDVKLAIVKKAIGDIYPAMQKSVLAGDNAYDIASPHIISGVTSLVTSKLLYDFNELPNVDFGKPWWNDSFTRTISVKGKLFYASGDIIVPNARVIVFNKQMMKELGKGDIYGEVRSGKWTLDKLAEYVKDVVQDENGDGVLGADDRFAFSDLSNTGLATSFVHGSGMLFLNIGADGKSFSLTLNSEKMLKVISKLHDSIYSGVNDALLKVSNEDFGNGSVLFGTQVLLKLQILRSYDTDFGIIPFPKYDEAQDKYYSSVWNGLLCVPVTISDPGCAGAVLEAMAYYSADTLTPAYYDKLLDSKFVRDNDSSAMLKLVFDGVIYDFGFIFDNWVGNYSSVGTLLKTGSTDLMSFYAQNEATFTSNYQKIFDAVE